MATQRRLEGGLQPAERLARPCAGRSAAGSGARLRARAHTAERGAAGGARAGQTWERVLRYPNGQERRIRYPLPAAGLVEEEEAAAEGRERRADWWGVERYYHELSEDEEPEWALPTTSGRGAIAEPLPANKPSFQGLPSTPEELLRYISSDEYKAARQEQLQLVRSSYQVLQGSPWLLTKPLFVLSTQQPGSDTGLTYTLRTRVTQEQAEQQLSKLLGRTRPDGSALIRCEELRDGIVAFEDEADAHRFASLLEADGTEALVAQCDGHELFRESQAARAVVVLLAQCSGLSCHLPMPEELAASLRGQRSLEDPADI